MRPKIPHVTKFGDSPARLVFRTNVIIFFGSRINVFEKKIDFTGLKSSQFYFEIQIKKTLQFNRRKSPYSSRPSPQVYCLRLRMRAFLLR